MSTRQSRNCAELLDAYSAGQRDFSGWSVRDGVIVKERFEGCRFDGAEFREIAGALSVFDNCCLNDAAFAHCAFAGASFLSSSMRGCRFDSCRMPSTDFFHTTLAGSSFGRCFLGGSCFLHADLSDCKIDDTTFAGSLFGRTLLNDHTLLGADFGDSVVALPHCISAAELRSIQHMGYVAHLLALSSEEADAGRLACLALPRVVDFLERGGVGADWLEPLRSAISLAPAERKGSVFVSYATEDQQVAEQLTRMFEQAGLDVWFAPRSMRGGRKLFDQLMRVVDARDRVVFVASPASLASPWVQLELRRALAAPEAGRRVVPVLLVDDAQWLAWSLIDPDSGRDLAAEVRSGRSYSLYDDQGGTVLRELIDELKPKAPAAASPSR